MKTILNVKVDVEAKAKAKEIAMQMGLPLSAIVNAQLREFIRTREFSVKIEPTLKPEVEEELIKLSQEYHAGNSEKIIFAKSIEEAKKLLYSK